MSSFFTLPASQRKRKRTQQSTARASHGRSKASRDADSISGSEVSEDDTALARRDATDSDEDEDDEIENEDPAAKRVRLAERYLANAQREVLDEAGFDAADVDEENLRRRMGERLKEDTAESKGKLYRWIADDFDWPAARCQICKRTGIEKTITGVAIQGNFVYAVSKDLQLVKLKLPETGMSPKDRRVSRQAKVVARTRGNKQSKHAQHHHGSLLCIAASQDGKFLATGGADKKLVVWDAACLKPLKVFTQHRDAVTAVAFRRDTNQLYSASKDRTIKTWSLNELAYVESLFGHQDEIVDVAALAQEKCISVGARDRTARLWNVVEEKQLVFRGGSSGSTKALEALKRAYREDGMHGRDAETTYSEGSIDRIAMLDDDTFVTGSDNGSLSLWNIHKKKAVHVLPLAHGLDEPIPLDQASAEQFPDDTQPEESRGGRQPRWITALTAIPFANILLSGSWDGCVRVWRLSPDKRRIESLGTVGLQLEDVDTLLDREGLAPKSLSGEALRAMKTGIESQQRFSGVVNDLAIVDQGERGKDGILIAAAVGKEHRLGRWREMQDSDNCLALLRVPMKVTHAQDPSDDEPHLGNGSETGVDFEGLD